MTQMSFFVLRGSCVYSARTGPYSWVLVSVKAVDAVTSQMDPGPTSIGAGDGNEEHSNLFRQVLQALSGRV